MRFKLSISFGLLLLLALTGFGQKPEARKIVEFGDISCRELKPYLNKFLTEFQKDWSTSRAYIIYYEGRHRRRNPIRGEADMIIARQVNNYLLSTRIEDLGAWFVDGGYWAEFTVQLWIVPGGSKPLEPEPTLTGKDIKFRKGNLNQIRACYAWK